MPLAMDIVDTFDTTKQGSPSVQFHTAPVQAFEPDPANAGTSRPKLTKDGAPIYSDVDYVTIRQPGDVNSVIFEADRYIKQIMPSEVDNKRLHPEHANRFKRAYEAFKEGKEAPIDGTSIKMWPVATPAQVALLVSLNIRSVEDLANLPDDGIRRIGMGGVDLKIKAKAWLAAASDKGKLTEDMVAIQKQNSLLEANMAAMAAQLEELKKQKEPLGDYEYEEPKKGKK